MDIKNFVTKETEKMWPEVLRFENPHPYYVDLSKQLWDLKHELLHKHSQIYEE
jgi:nicotinate phosphoribosyltransferase